MTISDQVEEVVEDEDNFHDPTLNALKMLLDANATHIYLDSLTLEGGLVEGLHIVDESAPVMSLLGTPVSSNWSQSLSDRSVNDAYSNNTQEGANQITNSSPSEKEGTWKQAKFRRHRKSTSKNAKGSSGKRITRNTGCDREHHRIGH
ncbi:hypothetical protein Nepgr_014594 [Nepenthes gracilis]|uniref:Uncharacterized protein n=1 Tax=Nepenthes gracilis TaxID=150966 RepID=A0AAD3SJT0_NEPGR|nr:hypothetical protein Nepgr_014594 [Nepenthes gracilis]